jgi:hypothetical protein
VLSPTAAEHLLATSLRLGALERIPEELPGFRAFCGGPFRRSVCTTVGVTAAEHVFERVGHVLWMATGDAAMIELARSWSEPDASDDDEDSGVRNLEGGHVNPTTSGVRGASRAWAEERATAPAEVSPATQRAPGDSAPSSPVDEPAPRQSGTRHQARRPAPDASFGTAATLGQMRAVSKSMPVVRSSIEIPAHRPDARSEPHELAVRLPSTVLLVTLDPSLVTEIGDGMKDRVPVLAVSAASELIGALVTAGQNLVVLLDTALPSIAIPAFAGLIPVLPAGTRVVLWGASARHLSRLVAIYPKTAGWIASDGAEDPVDFLSSLP